METLGGFPTLPALWLRRAKPGYANACSWKPWEGFQPFVTAIRPAKPLAASAGKSGKLLAIVD
jgi:hypothetical protein